MIRYWSKPIEGEIRDDQGISMLNPDTGMFMRYRVAGAYDSNIALLLTNGEDRLESYEHLSRGSPQHHPARHQPRHQPGVPLRPGQLVPRQNVRAKPTTRFVVPYLTLVGQLKEEANKLDPIYAFCR